jgi:hypothetical protein
MSNEAPKKIWLDSDGSAWEHYSEDDTLYIRADLVDRLVEALKICLAGNGYESAWEHYSEDDTPYIRADLVDVLVEALKICLAGNGYEFDDRPAEAALKALEEE